MMETPGSEEQKIKYNKNKIKRYKKSFQTKKELNDTAIKDKKNLFRLKK